ncbi:twin-arginine translocase TatA/TatE family subunit [Amycolatopsis sp. NPDC005232]|uniref:twin-arginine translocase TatA/TatE family subunit n=1 Tax=Amycolatopsis sp. NPDC005232 TaxID=3157027 RepID=UPI0033B3A006
MVGLSLDHLLVLLGAALFILGPERLPETARWLARTIHTIRGFAAGAQDQLRAELGPEFQQLRKPLQELQTLRTFDPKTALGRYLLDEAFTGPPSTAATATSPRDPVTTARTPLKPGERPPVDPDAT